MNTAGCNQHVSGLANAFHYSSGCYKKEAHAFPIRMLVCYEKLPRASIFTAPEFSDGFVSSDATLQPQALGEKCRLPSQRPWRLSSPSSIGALSITFWHLSRMDSTMAKSQKLQKPKEWAFASVSYIARYLRALKTRLNIMPEVQLNYHFRYQN